MSDPLKAVLFDLDGTLLDSGALVVSSYQHALGTHGLHVPTGAELLATMGIPLEVVFTDLGYGDRTDELIATYREHNLARHDEEAHPYPGAADMVRAFAQAGLQVGIVTSKSTAGAWKGVDLIGIREEVQVLIGYDDVVKPKPDPQPVRLGCERIGVDPAHTVYVGDAVVDMRSGRGAGCRVVAAAWGPQEEGPLRASQPDFWCEHPAEVPPVLLGR